MTATSYADYQRYAMLRLGLGCNVACPFCNVPWESYDYPMRLTLGQIKDEIDMIVGAGNERINVSGGEPTLRPELPEIIAYARSKGVKVVELQTNAILLKSRPLTARLKDAGMTHAFVGLHSHIPKVHDLLVKCPGAFEDCLQGTRNLMDVGVSVTLNPVITIANYRSLPAFIEFIGRALPGLLSISLSVVQPHGRAKANAFLLPGYPELSPYVEKALETAEGLGILVNNPFCGLPLCVGGWHKRLDRNVEYRESKLGLRPGDGEKFHPEACRECALQDGCGGIWKEYPSIHPIADIRPIRA